ncbi:hypothetical protein EON65_00110 [archaeon]|nr:MAG: hypothetical protein EON65_00110 [archaeon]
MLYTYLNLQDQKDAPLPAEALPVFAFPRHLRLIRSKKNEYPLPVFFTFVFTDQDGKHLYAACLKFFEAVPAELCMPVVKGIYGDNFVSHPAPYPLSCITTKFSSMFMSIIVFVLRSSSSPQTKLSFVLKSSAS